MEDKIGAWVEENRDNLGLRNSDFELFEKRLNELEEMWEIQ